VLVNLKFSWSLVQAGPSPRQDEDQDQDQDQDEDQDEDQDQDQDEDQDQAFSLTQHLSSLFSPSPMHSTFISVLLSK